MRTRALVLAAFAATAACGAEKLPTPPPPPPPPAPGVVQVSITLLDQDAPADGQFGFRVLGEQGTTTLDAGTAASREVAAGARTVILVSPDPGCSDEETNNKIVQVPSGGQVSLDFRVSCQNRFGQLRLVTVTSGVEFDADGYELSLTGHDPIAMGTNATFELERLLPAPRSISLKGLAPNCSGADGFNGSVIAPLSTPVTVIPGREVEVVLSVECHPVLKNVIAAHVVETGELWTVHPDGTGLAPAPLGRSFKSGTLALAPDGIKLAWSTDVVSLAVPADQSGLQVMFLDGTMIARSHLDQSRIIEPVWSHDSRMLLAHTRDGVLLALSADGSSPSVLGPARRGSMVSATGPLLYNGPETRIASGLSLNGSCFVPWCAPLDYAVLSPDGELVAHVCRVDGSGDPEETTVCVIDRAGANRVVHPMVNRPHFPMWSPDGDDLVYWSTTGIFVVAVDGSAPPRKLPFPTGAVRPFWSR